MENHSVVFLFILGTLVGLSRGQAGQPCHSSIFQFTPRHQLNISAYSGVWYIHEIGSSNVESTFPQPDWKCARRHLILPDPSDTLNIDVIDIFVNTTTQLSVAQFQAASVNNTRSPFSAMWTLTNAQQETSDVIILSADLEYAEWTVVYSCSIVGPDLFRHEYALAMTRSRTIDPTLRQYLKALMVGQGFRFNNHRSIDQTSC